MYVCGECGESADRAGACSRDGTQLTHTDDAMLGTMVGRYRVARLLGQGGMGRVYLAVQPDLGSRVAIKVVADKHAHDPVQLERFFAEARAVNLVHHENIVNVLDLDRLPDGRPVIVMELVEGQTLRALERAGELPLGGVIQAITEVLSAVAASHAIGIVHRDLKPDNILITATGRAKVLDFGIAKLAVDLPGQAAPLTGTGVVLGTPEYMSPEQIGGGTVDARTDIYAAGVVLFEAITGRLPFHGLAGFELMRAHVEQPPPSPRVLRPEVSPELEAVILTALAKQRGQRYESANAMANALHAAAATIGSDQWRALTPDGRLFPRAAAPPAAAVPPTPTTGPMPGLGVPTVRDRPSARKVQPPIEVTVPERPTAKRTPSAAPPAAPVARRRSRIPRAIGISVAAAALGVAVAAVALRDREPARPVVPITSSDSWRRAPAPHFDPIANLERAEGVARAQAADAKLVMMNFLGVQADGLGPGGAGIYVFASAATDTCVVVTQALVGQAGRGTCNTVGFVPHPACTLAQLWARAVPGDKPVVQGVRLTWSLVGQRPTWTVALTGDPADQPVMLDDNCR